MQISSLPLTTYLPVGEEARSPEGRLRHVVTWGITSRGQDTDASVITDMRMVTEKVLDGSIETTRRNGQQKRTEAVYGSPDRLQPDR